MIAEACNNLCSYDSQPGNGSGMCKSKGSGMDWEARLKVVSVNCHNFKGPRARRSALTRDEPLTSAKIFT